MVQAERSMISEVWLVSSIHSSEFEEEEPAQAISEKMMSGVWKGMSEMRRPGERLPVKSLVQRRKKCSVSFVRAGPEAVKDALLALPSKSKVPPVQVGEESGL